MCVSHSAGFDSDPMDCSPPGSSVNGMSQARILVWVAFPSPGELPDPEIEPVFLASPALGGELFFFFICSEFCHTLK